VSSDRAKNKKTKRQIRQAQLDAVLDLVSIALEEGVENEKRIVPDYPRNALIYNTKKLIECFDDVASIPTIYEYEILFTRRYFRYKMPLETLSIWNFVRIVLDPLTG
jgi:hypothetical protein